MRVLELSADLSSLYTCNYVEMDGKCRPGRSNFIVIGRNRHVHMPPGVMALYAYQASTLCIDRFDAEFHNVTQTYGQCPKLMVNVKAQHLYIAISGNCSCSGAARHR